MSGDACGHTQDIFSFVAAEKKHGLPRGVRDRRPLRPEQAWEPVADHVQAGQQRAGCVQTDCRRCPVNNTGRRMLTRAPLLPRRPGYTGHVGEADSLRVQEKPMQRTPYVELCPPGALVRDPTISGCSGSGHARAPRGHAYVRTCRLTRVCPPRARAPCSRAADSAGFDSAHGARRRRRDLYPRL